MLAHPVVARLWAAPREGRAGALVALGLLIYLLARSALTTAAEVGVASWWPAAAAAVLTLCVAKGHERWLAALLVVAASTAANLASGRPLTISLGFGLANMLEAVVFAAIVSPRAEPARLQSVRDVLRFAAAALFGALAMGLVAASVVTVFEGAAFSTILLSVTPSHLFAVFCLVPLGLVTAKSARPERRAELTAQMGLFVVAIALAYGPGRSLPLSFLVLPLLTWAAFRFGIRVVAWEICVAGLAASGLSSLGIDYFRSFQDTGTGVAASFVQLFLVTYSLSVLLLAAELAQRDDLLDLQRELVVALRDLNRQKDDFVSSVSHELRTPITSILGFAEELEDTSLDASQAQFTRVIVRNSHRLAQLVEDLLDLSRMSTRSEPSPMGSVDLAALVAECVEELGPQAQAAQVHLTAEFGPGVLELSSSPTDLRQVLTNLVSNAVKFTRPNGQVWVGCAADTDSDTVLLTVSDNGIGIPPADLERVFDRFFRSATAESLAGTGLGLPLAKGLVDRLGGSIDLQSDGVTGTHVTVALPRHPVIPPASAVTADSSAATTRM